MLGQLLPMGALAFLSSLHYTSAAPSHPPGSISLLDKRFESLTGCNDKQTTKVGQALADMANLALHAYDTAGTGNLGFSHYFKDSELNVFKSAMSTIAEDNDPTNAPYNFIVNCNPTDDIKKSCKQGKQSYAITDATVPKNDNDQKSIWLCPLFFTGDDSKNDLPSAEDKDKLDEWCNQDSYKKFTTAGHVLLHEITHLDAVAKKFPLEADPDTKEHGTEDYIKGSSPIEWARRLKLAVDNDPNRGDVPAPTYNAESYAGAATELWAMKFCQKDFIPPESGY